MKANETHLARLVEGTLQYLIPHFQRPYTWDKKHWETLWEDVEALAEAGEPDAGTPRHHFLGSIVTMPGHSVPEGVAKYLLIDGQQRMTTLLVLLAAVRSRASELGDRRMADKIRDLYLMNRYQDGEEQYKLLPTRGEHPPTGDRQNFFKIINNETPEGESSIRKAYLYFGRQLRDSSSERLQHILDTLLGRILLVSIVLERDDNPFAIFESLNAKGQPLSQADLIRNYFFMCISSDRHEALHSQKWSPMETRLGLANMTDYIRHFVNRIHGFVRQDEVYTAIRGVIDRRGLGHAETFLDELVVYSHHYARILNPQQEPNEVIRRALQRLNRLQATVVYPFLLSLLEGQRQGQVSDSDVIAILGFIETFIIRRYVCGLIRAELNKTFTGLYERALKFSDFSYGVREVLSARDFPSDSEFRDSLTTIRLYGHGERKERARFILERIEEQLEPRELAGFDSVSIEHVMPQTLSQWWREHLGEDWQQTHEVRLHQLGNLTLTGYNSELSNSDFRTKVALLENSSFKINRRLACSGSWTDENIRRRSEELADIALVIWPNFSPSGGDRSFEVRGRVPQSVTIMGEVISVSTWQDVLQTTLRRVADLGEDVLSEIARDFPRHVSAKAEGMRNAKILGDGPLFYEAHLNAEQIHGLCRQITQSAGLRSDEWIVALAT